MFATRDAERGTKSTMLELLLGCLLREPASIARLAARLSAGRRSRRRPTPFERRLFCLDPSIDASVMDKMEMLRLLAAATTVLAAIMVALNWSPRLTVCGFLVRIS